MTQNNLGIVLKEQARIAPKEKKEQLFKEAVASFNNALQIRTFQHLPADWAQTQNNLAGTYYAMENWEKAAECYANLVEKAPTAEAVQKLSLIYHEYLFRFEDAYALDWLWVVKWENYDAGSVCNFIEKHFTTARFEEAEKLLAETLENLKPEPLLYFPMLAIHIATLTALNKTGDIRAQMNLLITAVETQPEDFKITWTFNGTKHFIQTSDKLTARREWLLSLFTALEGKNRKEIADGLRKIGSPVK